MSIIYCEKHDRRWDSDWLSECPLCENEPASAAPDMVMVPRSALLSWNGYAWKAGEHVDELQGFFDEILNAAAPDPSSVHQNEAAHALDHQRMRSETGHQTVCPVCGYCAR